MGIFPAIIVATVCSYWGWLFVSKSKSLARQYDISKKRLVVSGYLLILGAFCLFMYVLNDVALHLRFLDISLIGVLIEMLAIVNLISGRLYRT